MQPVQGPSKQPVVYAGSSHPVQGPSEQPVVYASSSHHVQGLNEQPVVFASSGYVYNHNWANQPVLNQCMNGTLEHHAFDQAVRGLNEQPVVCASSGHVYAQNWANQPVANPRTNEQPMLIQLVHGASSMHVCAELDMKTKKVLNDGASADSVKVCTLCNAVCNSQEVLNEHLAGKRHATQVGLSALNGVGPLFAVVGSWPKPPNKLKVIQCLSCEVCEVECNSEAMYAEHLAGKKHQKNFGKLGNSSESNVKNPVVQCVTGPLGTPNAAKGKGTESRKRQAQYVIPPKSVETKRGKLLESESAIQTCTLCNVVCNGERSYSVHLAGRKHLSMVKREVASPAATTTNV